MEVYITNVDSQINDAQLHSLLEPYLKQFSIEVFDVFKRPGKTVAWLTITDPQKAQRFVAWTRNTLLINPSGRAAGIRVSNKAANTQLVRVLQKEEKDLRFSSARQRLNKRTNNSSDPKQQKDHQILISSFDCGSWETGSTSTNNTFQAFYRHSDSGLVTRQGRSIIVSLGTPPKVELHIDISTITSILLPPTRSTQKVVITLALTPKILELVGPDLLSLLLQQRHKYCRSSSFFDCDSNIAGSCLSYCLTVDSKQNSQDFNRALRSVTAHTVSITPAVFAALDVFPNKFDRSLSNLKSILQPLRLSFACHFQIEALWTNVYLSPPELVRLTPVLYGIAEKHGGLFLTQALRKLSTQLRESDYLEGGHSEAAEILKKLCDPSIHGLDNGRPSQSSRDEVSIHRVVITPTGMYLYGPEETAANRVLRQYRKHRDCFLRVTFADEDEERLPFDRDVSNDKILRGRFLSILRNGVDVAGQHFDFLGFSHSSLRAQSCWFMRPFNHDGSLLTAQALVKKLGDFSTIRCPAKCAARIGQAFSESTSAINVNPNIVDTYEDIKHQQYTFTDGCGTVSLAVWNRLKKASSAKLQPTSYQIRYQGAKGMLSLDARLSGEQMRLRKSMVKFTGSPSSEIEVCGTNARTLPFKLNRQLIKILEDLQVGPDVFEDLQVDAVEKLRSSATSRASAVDFLRTHLSDSATGLPSLLQTLTDIHFDVTEDSFLREILGALLQVELRNLKYRSRILVPQAMTLYGICDESASLKEGEVVVVYTDSMGIGRYLSGKVAITRSPALHPGDIQVVTAVEPQGLFLEALLNCVVFSQKGSRDLPSMLSGGDLDGDLYNIIFDTRLIPSKLCSPASYTPARAQDIERPVTTDDMTSFFIDFMENDQLGRIATLHQVFADLEQGTLSPECLKLASLHSTAVDFSKSGIPVDVKQIPKAPRYRPDFMAPSTSVKVEKGIKRPSDVQSEDTNEPHRFRYYESHRVLGRLYRAIDEDIFFQDLEDDTSSMFSRDPSDDVIRSLLRLAEKHTDGLNWQQHIDTALEVKEHYEYEMLDIMTQYASGSVELLSEKEVWIGKIVGRSGAGSKFQREQSDYMKSRFNRSLRDIKEWMDDKMSKIDDGFLCLAVACLHVAVHNPTDVTTSKLDTPLKSFGWFAAAMCLPDLMSEQFENDSTSANDGAETSPFDVLRLGELQIGSRLR